MRITDAFCVAGEDGREGIAPEQLVSSMDRNNIEKSVICCADRYAAVYNREGNDYLKAAGESWPDRFYCFASVNPWFGKSAELELENRLKDGFNGVYFKPSVQGFTINEDMVYPFIELCEKHSVPAYFHTGTPMQALPFNLMFLAMRYPKVNFIMGHMGLYDYFSDALAAAQAQRNIYLETSPTLSFFIRVAAKQNADRLLFGSYSPRSTQEFELKKIRNAVEDTDMLTKILDGNIRGILGGAI